MSIFLTVVFLTQLMDCTPPTIAAAVFQTRCSQIFNSRTFRSRSLAARRKTSRPRIPCWNSATYPFLSMIAIAVALLALVAQEAAAQGKWHDGRATFYGKDAWSIHTGSCGYGYLDEKAGTGWDVAAASDANWDYKGSCGTCREVKCKPVDFSDGYGQWLQRKDVCHDPHSSVVVTIVDSCPCTYPGNSYSNKRWCCGDMYHLDLSIWTFEKLTDLKWGVIALSWREVPCWFTPKKHAKNPWGQRQGPERGPPRGDWQTWMDKRPYNQVRWWDSGRRLRGVDGFQR